ncbi:YihY/virulence factor BrkB family protein [Marivirga sp. S37H4]|uniref:YihY/virulence factor BrkB family protein n=1 Tax=Marivirga aurantiaca TaxID=2802615 RepID=A0A934WYF6_9BACT|nr:YihY/virulence factor BrkB family protein [Marivirga aurantiaca]MBK6265478.1 YihY/virulence factor BrkB family protein [Marivirga aurantiaca]
MTYFFKKWFKIFKDSTIKFFDENPFHHSASTAYFTIFSLPAIGIVSITLAGYFYEDEVVRTQFLDQINQLMGQSSAEQVDSLLNSATISADRWIFKVIGVGTLVFSATTVFISLQDSLNAIWHIKAKPKKGIIKFIVNRLLSLAMIAALGFLLLVSLLADTVISFINTSISGWLDTSTIYLVQTLNIIVSLSFITLVFAIIFKVLPDAKLKWRDVWVGAFVTTILFVAGKFALGFYLGTANLTDSYGAAGSFVAILVWVYYSVLILLFGAQLTYVYAHTLRRVIPPKEDAVEVEIIEKEL